MEKPCFMRPFLILTFAASLLMGGAPFFIVDARAQEVETLTLPLAVERALKANPLIRITLSSREMADAQLKEAYSGLFPMLQFSETFIRSNNPVFVFGSLLEQARFGPENFNISSLNGPESLSNFRTTVAVKQSLFDQWQTGSRIIQARIGQKQADLQKAHVEQQLRFEVLRAYYGCLVSLAKKGVAEDAIKVAEADLKRVRDRFDKGLTVQSDLLAAEVQLAEFRQQQIQAEGELAIAHAALNTLLDLPANTPQKITGELVAKKFDVDDPEDLVRSALLHRSDYGRAEFGVLSRKEGVRGAKGQFLPRLDLFATYGASGRNLSTGSSDYTIGTSLTFNLFDAGRSARISQARAAEEMAAAEQQHLANQIRFEVVRSYRQYISARERLALAARVIDQATETLRIVQNRYREGLTTITEMLRAQNALVQARMNLVAARYEHYLGYASVLLATGRLTDVEPFAL